MMASDVEKELSRLLQEIHAQEAAIAQLVDRSHPLYQASARNLFVYLMIRSKDLRLFHGPLSDLGISALRTTESHAYSNLTNVIAWLRLIQGKSSINFPLKGQSIDYSHGKQLIGQHAQELFDIHPNAHHGQVMVTLPIEAAEDKAIVLSMAEAGMDVARINLSHGEQADWGKMVHYVQEVSKEIGHRISIYMDLSGPKLRTAAIRRLSKKGKPKDKIPVRKGEQLLLTKKETWGRKSVFNEEGKQIQLGEVGVMLPQLIDDAEVGDPILFDDGMIKAKVVRKGEEELELQIVECYKSKLGSRKGINLPQTQLNLPALTQKDRENLAFVCEHADLVGYSFVRSAEDVEILYQELAKYPNENLGVIFKIENKEAFENLPAMLFAAMTRPKIGVMIARGDLAVEIGFERISEVQNQILWLCEAAHIPVVWATQVLENLAKTGIPTRAEISDAAQAAQAECVMLNKGPHINQAIRTLKNILARMEGHASKKKNELRALNVAKAYVANVTAGTIPSPSLEFIP